MQLTKLYVFAHQFRITNLYKLKLLCLKCIHHELPSESYIFVRTFDRSTFFRSVRLTVHDGFQLINHQILFSYLVLKTSSAVSPFFFFSTRSNVNKSCNNAIIVQLSPGSLSLK